MTIKFKPNISYARNYNQISCCYIFCAKNYLPNVGHQSTFLLVFKNSLDVF